jgi:hypothetical protein
MNIYLRAFIYTILFFIITPVVILGIYMLRDVLIPVFLGLLSFGFVYVLILDILRISEDHHSHVQPIDSPNSPAPERAVPNVIIPKPTEGTTRYIR